MFRRIRERSRSVLSLWRTLAALTVLVLFLSGMRARVFTTAAPEPAAEVARPVASPVMVPPARLEQLPAGMRLEGEGPPAGWSHLVFKSIPRLASGDLDTVSEQAFEIARRLRPLMTAEVRRASRDPSSPFVLRRVGVGLCAPGSEEGTDVVVTSTSVAGTQGPWTMKQRLILAAMSYETSRARMSASTSRFALVRTPVVFLVEGRHRKIDLCYALRVEPRTGEIATHVWPVLEPATGASPSPATARRLTSRVFDLPQDVHATKALGNLAVAWSFAIRGLPDGPDLALTGEFVGLAAGADGTAGQSAAIERALRVLVEEHEDRTGVADRAAR